jgi:hypothetical protein
MMSSKHTGHAACSPNLSRKLLRLPALSGWFAYGSIAALRIPGWLFKPRYRLSHVRFGSDLYFQILECPPIRDEEGKQIDGSLRQWHTHRSCVF